MMHLMGCTAVVALAFLAACAPITPGPKPLGSPESMHERLLTIDTHVDTPLRLIEDGVDLRQSNAHRRSRSKVDFVRMREGGLDAAFFAIYIGQGARTPEGHEQAEHRALHILDAVDSVLAANADLADVGLNSGDAALLASQGRRAIYLGMENGYPIGRDLAKVGQFYDRGIRYITLCHIRNNEICDSSMDSTEFGGLSPFGAQVVREMNRLGMMVDVSHISDRAVVDALAVSRAPVIASHSCARALRDHPRNIPDSLLTAIAQHGGVVQLCLLSAFVKQTESYAERDSARAALRARWDLPGPLTAAQQDTKWQEEEDLARLFPSRLATVSDAIDHLDHMVRVMGIDHVGIGSDFDGGGALADCYDVSELPAITRELLKRGYSETDIAKIWGGNLMRVFQTVEAIADPVG